MGLLVICVLGWYALNLHERTTVLHPWGHRVVLRWVWVQPLLTLALTAAFFRMVRCATGRSWRDLSGEGRFVVISSLVLMAALWWFGRGDFYAHNLSVHAPQGALRPLFSFFWFALWCTVLRLVIPLGLMRWPLRRRPAELGWRFQGFSQLGWVYLGLALAVCLVVIVWASTQPAFLRKYPLCRAMIRGDGVLWWHFLLYQAAYLLIFVSGESFWRGWISFGLERDLGRLAVVFMLIPYVAAHLGKPLPETLGAIATGTVLGLLALRHRSFWLGVAAHYAVALTMDLAAMARQCIGLLSG